MNSPLLQGLRDLVLAAGSALVAELSAGRLAQQPVAEVFLEWSHDLAVYVGLSIFASVARGFFDARDGRLPDRHLLFRAAIIAAFVGVVGGVLVTELDWSPGFKLASISLCSFFLDWSIPAIGRAWRAWLVRAAAPPAPDPPPQGGDGK